MSVRMSSLLQVEKFEEGSIQCFQLKWANIEEILISLWVREEEVNAGFCSSLNEKGSRNGVISDFPNFHLQALNSFPLPLPLQSLSEGPEFPNSFKLHRIGKA